MAAIYQDNSIYVNLENIEEILKIIAEIISKPSEYFLNKITSDSTTNVDIKLEKKVHSTNNVTNDYGDKNMEIFNTMDSIAGLLKKNDLFYDEYFDFCEIQDMTKDTLNRDSALIKKSDLEFLLELVKDFSDLINFKINLIKNDDFDDEKYKSKYNSYLTDFNNSQTYFYENICDETLDDDLFMEYTNIIME